MKKAVACAHATAMFFALQRTSADQLDLPIL